MAREKPTTRLRNLLKEGRTLVQPCVYDALSAMIVERAGFKMCAVTGNGLSIALLGKPDMGLTTLNEVVTICGHIAKAVKVPVTADADTGYGNAINMMRAVEDFIGAGIAGIQIEDQIDPKRCGYIEGIQIISLKEMVGKVRAADRVRRELDPDFVLIVRTDARLAPGGSTDEAIRRLNAYRDAGADILLPVGPFTEPELERYVREVRGPLKYARTFGKTPMLSIERLNELGIAMCSTYDINYVTAAHAMWDSMHAFAKEDVEFLKRLEKQKRDHPMGSMDSFIGVPEFRKLEEEFVVG
jgi:2-methylisocitrate lyase-like PEP mutase family enzyme